MLNINLSSYGIDSSCLKYGLYYSFIDKNKLIKQYLGGAECELLALRVDKCISSKMNDKFCEFLGKTTQTLTMFVILTLKLQSNQALRDNKDITIPSGDKDNSMVLMNNKL